ncbi:MAG: M28 family peptidase, partial [Sphingomonadales bacterium]
MIKKFTITCAYFMALVACDQATPIGVPGEVIVEPTLFTDANFEAQKAIESDFLSRIDGDSLYAYHDMLASVPHTAGSVGDAQVIASIANAFEEMGLEVEVHEFWALLPTPISASLEITSPDKLTLNLFEDVIEGDEYTNNAKVEFGYNGYSGSGTVESEIVYVNRGTKPDFDKLEEMGISLKGKIALARYGGNFRGYKAKFAEAAGAIGLLIFTDPADSGYAAGLPYPEGGADTSTSMQRGGLKTTAYSGDPLTPGVEATEHADRLAVEEVEGLPGIPVQPISWGVAEKIMSLMTGREVHDNLWQGGLPLRYRIIGGPDLRVKLMVDQKWEIKKSANVLGTLRGTDEPKKKILVGSHHDAWIYGAIDAQAGTITVMETARIMSEMAREGIRPKRSIVFAGWGAEEQGLIGSTEWVEANLEDLQENAIAYINLDAAATGPYLGSSASPSIQRAVINAADRIPYGDGNLLEHWLNGRDNNAGGLTRPSFGNLGGGSDHQPF